MAAGFNKVLSIIVFAILYSYTTAGVILIIFLSWFNAKILIR
jgi:hypothetical protein